MFDILKNIENELNLSVAAIQYPEQEADAVYLETLRKISEFRIEKNSSILDVGTGYGVMPLVLSKRGFRVWAIDKTNYLEKFGTFHIFKKYGVQFSLVDVSKDVFPFPDNFFDCIISLSVIDHLNKSPKKFLSEIYRVLKKNGHFILVASNFASLDNRIISILRFSHPISFKAFCDATETFEGHVRVYIPKEIKKMLIWGGFKLLKLYTFNVANLRHYVGYKKIFKTIVRILQKIFFFDKYNKEQIISISIKE